MQVNVIRPELKDYIENEVLPCYEGVDPAHGIDHIRIVTSNALEIAKHYEVDIEMVYAIASYHDIGIRYGREDHELTSGKWLYEDQRLRGFFDKGQILVMKEAVEDHRASSKHEPRTIYGAIIAEADRDLTPMRIIERCVDHTIAHNKGANEEECIAISLAHLQDKYGHNGYLKLYLHDPRNEEGLATLRRYMDEGKMEDLVREIYAKKR